VERNLQDLELEAQAECLTSLLCTLHSAAGKQARHARLLHDLQEQRAEQDELGEQAHIATRTGRGGA